MATTPVQSRKPLGRASERARRLRMSVPVGDDIGFIQKKSVHAARRRLRNVEQKIAEARFLLADAPPEVPAEVRTDLWTALQLVQATNDKLILKRGRKPLPPKRPDLPPQKQAPVRGTPTDTTTMIAL